MGDVSEAVGDCEGSCGVMGMKRYLGDVCHFYTGTGFPTELQGKTSGELPFYKVGDISINAAAGNTRLSMCNNYISRQEANELKGTILPADTIVFAKIGEALKLNRRAITNCDCLVDNNVMGIAPDAEVLRIGFFFYFMKRLKMQDLAESTTVPSVRKSKLERVEITVPSIEEQIEIERKLQATDSIIQKRKQQLSALDNLIKARFVEMTEGADTVPTRMGDVATYINGYAFKPIDWAEKGLPIIRIQNLNDSSALFNYFSGNIDDKYRVFSGDVLVSWATHLEAYIWTGGDAWLNQHIFRVVFDKMPINKVYFVYSTEEALKQAFRNAHGFKPTMEHIKKNDFENAIVKLPSLYVQEEFARFAEQIDKSKSVIQKSLDETQLLFDSLIQHYFG